MVSTPASADAIHRWQRWSAPMVLGAATLVAIAVALAADIGAGDYRLAGLGFPGWPSATGYLLLRVCAALAGAMIIGSLAYALCCVRTAEPGRVDVDGYAGIRVAERAAIVLTLASLALIPVSAADAAGVTVATMLRHGALGTLIDAEPRPKAWIVVAVIALTVAIAMRFTLSWNGLFGLAALTAIAVVAPSCVGNAAEGPDHDYGTGAVIAFTLALSVPLGLTWCLAQQLRRADTDESRRWCEPALRRYRIILGVSVTFMVPTAAILAMILAPPGDFGGSYGWLGVTSAVLLLLHAVVAWRLPDTRRAGRWLSVLVPVQSGWLAVSVAMACRPAPAFAHHPFTAQQALLGFDLPQAPDLTRLVGLWRFDIILGTSAVAMAGFYLWGVRRLRRRGDAWSKWRAMSWIVGCSGLLIVTSSGVSTYGYAMFSMHMVVHMALNMFVPVLFVLGAPITLLLRAIEPAAGTRLPGPREWALWLMHSRFTRILSNAVVALAIFVVSLYGLYFTPLFGQLIRFHWGHLLMNIHFLLTGYLYYWAIIGIDPGPRRLPHIGRLGMLFAIMPFHAFFGVAMMSMDSLVGGRFYPYLNLRWIGNLLADQRLGGELAWISGEIPALIVVAALLSQWARQDRRLAVRTDRRQEKAYREDDDELAAYNAMLAQLARNRK